MLRAGPCATWWAVISIECAGGQMKEKLEQSRTQLTAHLCGRAFRKCLSYAAHHGAHLDVLIGGNKRAEAEGHVPTVATNTPTSTADNGQKPSAMTHRAHPLLRSSERKASVSQCHYCEKITKKKPRMMGAALPATGTPYRRSDAGHTLRHHILLSKKKAIWLPRLVCCPPFTPHQRPVWTTRTSPCAISTVRHTLHGFRNCLTVATSEDTRSVQWW
jgi:hypothetical protein